MEEIWQQINGFSGKYYVSNKGNIKKYLKTNNIFKSMKPSPDTKGYIRIGLSENGAVKHFSIHRLVLKYFLFDSKLHVNHKDGDKSNNHVDNLEYVTPSENNLHALNNNLRKTRKSIISIDNKGNEVKHISISHCCLFTKCGYSSILKVLRGEQKSSKGFMFKSN